MMTDEEIILGFLNADGSLRQMPSRREPRLLVLSLIARRFTVGIELPETAVDTA